MKLGIATTAVCLATAWHSALGAGGAEIGQKVPDFSLTDITGKTNSLSAFKGKYIVLEWTNFDCPFVKKHYGTGNMQALQKKYTEKGVAWLTINSSAPGKPGNYPPEKWQEMVKEKGSAATAVLLDPAGKVGKLYGAKTTPHMFVINPDGALIYMGAWTISPLSRRKA